MKKIHLFTAWRKSTAELELALKDERARYREAKSLYGAQWRREHVDV